MEEVVGVRPELKPGSGGIFDVIVDGKLVFSKFEVGNFPDEEALTQEIAALR